MYLLRRDLPQILEIRCDMAVTKDYTVSQKAEYLQTIVNSLKRMGKERDTSRQFLVSARLLASEDSLSLVERFRLISGGTGASQADDSLLVTGALCLLFVSYLFIFQSAYEPDMEDVLTEDGAAIYVPNYDGAYLILHDDGTCTIVFKDGSSVFVSSPSIVGENP